MSKSATEKEIKAAYRKLARQFHPDMNQGDKKAEARFKEVGEQQQVSSSSPERARYDQLGANWQQYERAAQGRGGGAGAGAWPGGGNVRVEFGDELGGFSDFFKTFFGGGGGAGFGSFFRK